MKKLLFLLPLIYANLFFAQNTTIPDANFEQALINFGLDTAPIDGFVPTANIDTVISLDVSAQNISDLTGIQDFNALIELNCGVNPISTIDVSQNLNLKFLTTSNNFQLTSLDVSQNLALTYLNCSLSPQLTVVDVRNGNNVNFTYFSAQVDMNLKCIYVDDKNASYMSSWIKDTSAHWVNDTLDCQNVTSLNEYDNKSNFLNIYPNPATNYAYFEFENLPAELIIYNMQQRIIFKEQIETKTYKLELGGFKKGVYLCGVFGDNTINKLIII